MILVVSAAYAHALMLDPSNMSPLSLRKFAIWHSVFLGLIMIGLSIDSAMKCK